MLFRSPDTCRLWDAKTREKLDKDRFRRDLGGVEDAYRRVMERLTILCGDDLIQGHTKLCDAVSALVQEVR